MFCPLRPPTVFSEFTTSSLSLRLSLCLTSVSWFWLKTGTWSRKRSTTQGQLVAGLLQHFGFRLCFLSFSSSPPKRSHSVTVQASLHKQSNMKQWKKKTKEKFKCRDVVLQTFLENKCQPCENRKLGSGVLDNFFFTHLGKEALGITGTVTQLCL